MFLANVRHLALANQAAVEAICCSDEQMQRCKRYALLPAATAPPIVLEGAVIQEGCHRLIAAILRGEETICAEYDSRWECRVRRRWIGT
jgi:hypothetical protein